MSEKVTVYVGIGAAPDPSPPGIMTKDYISAANIDAAIADALATFLSTYSALSVLTAANTSGVPFNAIRYVAFGAGGGFTSVPWGCPLPTCVAKTLRVKPSANTLTVAAARVTILKNGVATGLMVTIPAGSTALQSISLDVPFASGDTTSVQIDTDAGGAGSINVVVSMTIATALTT